MHCGTLVHSRFQRIIDCFSVHGLNEILLIDRTSQITLKDTEQESSDLGLRQMVYA